jgi:ribosomal protein S18 acetylase RimI-like enzyme
VRAEWRYDVPVPPLPDLRPVGPDDDEIYFAIFAAVRARELQLDALDAATQALLLRSQFVAQRDGYAQQFPHADEQLIFRAGAPIGWVIVDRTGASLHGIDIGLLPDEQSHGTGTAIIRALQGEAAAAGRDMTIAVQRFNVRALSLYDRLGFRLTGETPTHVTMVWRQE